MGVIGINQWPDQKKLSNKSLRDEGKKKSAEKHLGVYYDIYFLLNNGFIVQNLPQQNKIEVAIVPGDIIPNRLQLTYPERLLFNGLQLDKVNKVDLEKNKMILK